MADLTQNPRQLLERSAALADLTRALASTPGAAEVAKAAAAALRRGFPAALAAHAHQAGAPPGTPVSLLEGADPLAGIPAAAAALRRAAREQALITEPLPVRKGEPAALLVIAPVVHSHRVLGTVALTLAGTTPWLPADAEWLALLAQQTGLGLAQEEAERRFQEMSAQVEARAQARVEQLAGRGRQLEALFHLSSQIGMTLDEARVTSMALDHLIALTRSRFGFVAMIDPAGALELTCVRSGDEGALGGHGPAPGTPGSAERVREALRVALPGLQELLDRVTVSQRSLRQNQEARLPASGDAASLRLDSLLAVPLCSGNRPLGALVLVGRLPGYDEADERLVTMFGLQVAVAVQNARMVAKIEGSLQTRRRELASLSRTAQELASAPEEATLLDQVVTIIDSTFDARSAWVMLRDAEAPAPIDPGGTGDGGRPASTSGGPLRLRSFRGAGPPPPAAVPLSDPGIVGETFRKLTPIFRDDMDRPSPAPASLLCVPLVVGDRALGVLGIDSARFSARRPPRPQDLDLIQAFASQAAVAIENARLMGAADRRTRRERRLNEILAAVRAPVDVADILHRAVERLGTALEVSRCVALLPQPNGEYREHVWTDPRFELPSDAIFWEACPAVQRLEETRQPLVLADASKMPELLKLSHDIVPPRALLGLPAFYGEDGESRSGAPASRRSGPMPEPSPPDKPESTTQNPKSRAGVLFLFHQCDGPREWSEDDLSLAERVAGQVAVAVENAQLHEQELKQEQFQRTMAEIATAVGSSVELTQVLRAVGEQGMRLLGADAAYIWRLDEASRELVSAAAVGHKADRFHNLRLALTRRSFHVVRAAVERGPIVAHGIGSDRQASQRLNRMFDCQSLLAVPLLLREKVIGVVQFSIATEGAAFDADQVAQAKILVSQAAAAVENAQLYEAERGRAEELELLWRIGQEIAENLQPERIFTSIVAGARQLLAVEGASLMMFEEDDDTLSVAAAEGLSPEHVRAIRFRRRDGIPRCVAVDGAHRMTSVLAEDTRYPRIAGQEGPQSMLSVPMPDGTQIAGALNAYSSRRRQFSVEEAQKLDLLAAFAMAALRQARQIRREQKIAEAFQRDLLPELKLDLAGFDVAPKSIAALTAEADFGGDFYDVHPISETKIGLAIGDVSGKGLAAAPQRAMVKCVLRAFAFESPSPGTVLDRLNRLLFRTMETEQFVTLFYGVLDVRKGELTYANAGHELPLVLRRGSGTPELLETTGPLLAVDGESRYRQICTPIGPGDTLVLYTDGFTEARRGSDFLQVEGLASLLDEFREGSAGDMVESISRSVEDQFGSLRDDATILVVKSVGGGAADEVMR